MTRDTVERFTDRVADYARHRHYPAAPLDLLTQRCGFTPAWTVADIGVGTGILTELLLRNGNVVRRRANDAVPLAPWLNRRWRV